MRYDTISGRFCQRIFCLSPLYAGDVFEHNGTAFLKTRRPHNAVNLADGTFALFDDLALVDKSDLVLVRQAVLPAEMPEHLKGGLKHGKD